MAISLVRSYTNFASVNTSLSITSVDTSGGDFLRVVAMGPMRSGTVTDVTAHTWDGSAMTLDGNGFQSTGTGFDGGWAEGFHVFAPTGTHTVALTIDAADSWMAVVEVWAGVHQSAPYGTFVNLVDWTDLATTISSGSMAGDVNGMYADYVMTRNDMTSPTVTGTGQSRPTPDSGTNPISNGGAGGQLNYSVSTGNATRTMAWSWTGSQKYLYVAVPLLPSSGGGATNWQSPVYQIGKGAPDAMIPSGFIPPSNPS